MQIWHDGKHIGLAKPLDAYANCFVKRNRLSFNLTPDAAPKPPPQALSLRKLDTPADDDPDDDQE